MSAQDSSPTSSPNNSSENADVESVERVIPAPAEAIFELLADPDRHRDIDGSGSVRNAKNSTERLKLGSKFGMAMNKGIPYSMVNTVIEFEDGRRIAWLTLPPIGARLLGGPIWRYELEPVEGGTLVRESWDLSREKVKAIVAPVRKKTRVNMARTLERIEQIVTTEPA